MAGRGDVTDRQNETDSRRTKSRWGRFVILLLIPILLVAGGGTYLLTRHTKPDTRQADSEAAVRAYLSAWARADYAGMAAQSDATPAAIQAVAAPVRRDLLVTSARYSAGTLTRDSTGDRGTAPYNASLTLSGLGIWRYSGTLSVAKTKNATGDDVWKVHFTPAAVHPRLTAGRTLARTHLSATRGRLLDADGIPLRGADAELDSNLLGVVGPLTAAQAKEAGPQFAAGDVAGQTGIERVYNRQLAGDPGARSS